MSQVSGDPIKSKKSRRARRGVAVLAGLTSAGLLFGSTTTALWTDSVTVDGGAIVSGNLDIEPIDEMVWTESSVDVAPKVISLEEYKIIPGDVIEGSQEFDVALDGSNLLATLQILSDSAVTGDLASLDDGVTIKYWVENNVGGVVLPPTVVGSDTPVMNIVRGSVGTALDSVADYKVFVKATFDKNTPEQVRTQAQAFLSESFIQLKQVRTPVATESGLRVASDGAFVNDGYTEGTIDVGDTVLYSVEVYNGGTSDIEGLYVVDDWLNSNGTEFTASAGSFGPFGLKLETPTYDLKIGERRTFTATHTFTSDQLSGESISISPRVMFLRNGVEESVDGDSVEITSEKYNSAISTVASLALNNDAAYSNAANTVDYGESAAISFVVTNDSSINVPVPTIKSVNGGLTAGTFAANKTGELAPGESVEYTATKTFTVAELHAGTYNLSAEFSTTVNNEEITSSKSLTVATTPVTNNATINFTQSLQDSNSNGTGDVGERLNISGTWTNTSNVAVKYTGLSGKAGTVWTSQPTVNTIVNPGQSLSFSGYYTLASGDVTGSPVTVTYTVNWSPEVVAQGGQTSRNSQIIRSTATTVQSKTLSFTAASTSGTYLKDISTPWGNGYFQWRANTNYNYPKFYSSGSAIYNIAAGGENYAGQLWNTSKNSVDITIGGISGSYPGIAFNFDRSGDYPKGLIAFADGSYWRVYGSTGRVNAGAASAYNVSGSAGGTITTLRVVSNGTTAQVYANGNLVWNHNITNINGYNYSTGTYHGIGGYWYGSGPRFTSFSMTS